MSYPAPTFQAVKQIFESILWLRSAEVIPWRAEICHPVVFHRYYTNYNGPLRKDANSPLGAETAGAHQLIATVLVNVRYKLHAFVIRDGHAKHYLSPQARKWLDQGINGAHAYKDRFEFRLKRGQWHHTPFLGWKEFTPSELGPVRDDTFADKSVDGISLPSLLHRSFPRGQFTGFRPSFRTEWGIRKGVLDYFPNPVLEAMQKGDFRNVE